MRVTFWRILKVSPLKSVLEERTGVPPALEGNKKVLKTASRQEARVEASCEG